MQKNHSLFGFFAVIAVAAITLFAGCSNGSTDDDPLTAVVLARGSHGIAGNGKNTGLAEGSQYIVKTGGQWFAVSGDGELMLPAVADPDLAVDGGAELSSGITEIIGDDGENPLVNGRTYDVYLYKTASGT